MNLPIDPSISFRKLSESDFRLLHKWLNMPHMRRFYQRAPVNLEQVITKYGPRVRGEQPTSCHVAEVNGVPVGKFQCYKIIDYPEFASSIGIGEGVSVDLFIGEPEFLARGLGTILLRKYVSDVASTLFPDELHCYIVHEAENAVAQKCSISAGFTLVREVIEDGAKCNLYLRRIRKQ